MQNTTTYPAPSKKGFHVAASSVVLFISTLFILLFGYTATSKLLDVPQFIGAMQKSELIKPYAAILAYAVPIVELIVCLLLAFPFIRFGKKYIPTRKIGLYGAALLMFLFTGYVIITLVVLRANLPCTCGGFISSLTWRQHLFFNGSFLFLALYSLFFIHKHKNSTTV